MENLLEVNMENTNKSEFWKKREKGVTRENRRRAKEIQEKINDAINGRLPILNQTQAAGRRLTHFFSGKDCKSGHVGLYYTKSGKCVTCEIARTNGYRARVRSLKKLDIDDASIIIAQRAQEKAKKKELCRNGHVPVRNKYGRCMFCRREADEKRKEIENFQSENKYKHYVPSEEEGLNFEDQEIRFILHTGLTATQPNFDQILSKYDYMFKEAA
jgi:hypothetical protein